MTPSPKGAHNLKICWKSFVKFALMNKTIIIYLWKGNCMKNVMK